MEVFLLKLVLTPVLIGAASALVVALAVQAASLATGRILKIA